MLFFLHWFSVRVFFFFFQAEDGIRDLYVTGVQTCALPISGRRRTPSAPPPRTVAGGDDQAAGDPRHHRRLRRALRRAAARAAGGTPSSHVAPRVRPWLAAARRGVRHHG